MKKYPFSKKALKAMLAVTVALTPIVTSSIVFDANKVEAAATDLNSVSSVDDLITYLDSIYDQVEDKDALLEVKAELDKQDWYTYAEQVAKKPIVHPSENKELLAGLMELFASTTVLDLQGKINTFKTEQKDNVKTVFGAEFTVENVLNYIAIVETAYLKELKGINLESANETDVYWAFVDSVFAVNVDPNVPDITKNVGSKFLSLVDAFETLNVLKQVANETDPNGVARKELINALKKVQPIDTVNPGGGVPPVTQRPEKNPQLPPGTVEVEKETNPATGQTVIKTTVSADKVGTIVNLITAEVNTLAIQLENAATGETVQAQLPAALFTEAAKKNGDAVVEIKTEEASYSVPASQINVTDLAEKLGVPAADVTINISVNVVNLSEVQDSVTNNQLNLKSKVIEFTVEAVSGDKKESITTFSTYVERDIVGDAEFNSNNSVAVRFDDDGTISPIPTLFNGKVATAKSLTNSKYTIVENNVTFPDVNDKKNWAENYIETLASKYIIKGKPDGKFVPGENMTRAQFTVLLVKALGLPGEKYEQKFKDVKETDWFNLNRELAAATKYGIIQGKPDGRFAPNEKITRTQAAVMLHRAMQLSFVNLDEKKLDKTKKVTDFKDVAKIADWSKPAIEAIFQAGIMSGKPDSTFDPNGATKRDQMAKMLAEFLIAVDLMNDIK